jgi:hypothetical protein
MATPHVAGVIALMLQYDSHLQAIDIPGILRQTARLDADTGVFTNGSPVWGFGKLDARTATGFFRLTLVTTGIPSYITVPVQVDGKNNLEPSGGSWVELYFLKGGTHTVSLDTQIQGEPGTRYELEKGGFAESANSLEISMRDDMMLNYTVQYLLVVNSRFGPTLGGGWYNVNATVKLGAPSRVLAGGALGYLGVAYTLAYWVGEDGRVVTNPVVMDAPNNVTAAYVLNFPVITFVVAMVVLVGILVSFVVIARKWMS